VARHGFFKALLSTLPAPVPARLQYLDSGHVISTGTGAPLTISKGGTTVIYTTGAGGWNLVWQQGARPRRGPNKLP
jgi:hypothetical protein